MQFSSLSLSKAILACSLELTGTAQEGITLARGKASVLDIRRRSVVG